MRSDWLSGLSASLIAVICLGIMYVFDSAPLPSTPEAAAVHPYWSTIIAICIIAAAWFLSGTVLAEKHNSRLEETADPPKTY